MASLYGARLEKEEIWAAELQELQDNPVFAELVRSAGVGPHEQHFHTVYGEYAGLSALIDIRLSVADALAGAPANELMEQGGEPARGSRVQTRETLLAVKFFGGLTQVNGFEAVINAAIADTEGLRKSLRPKISSDGERRWSPLCRWSPATRRAAEQLMSNVESWLAKGDEGRSAEQQGEPGGAGREVEQDEEEQEMDEDAPRCGVCDALRAVSVCLTCTKRLCTTCAGSRCPHKGKGKRRSCPNDHDMHGRSGRF
ncbi:hypothetical protein HDU86_006491 [Geranomyces michiganensis]|nr:hypothetical protein HDU86_006491 [Geranomyces michiganensis]